MSQAGPLNESGQAGGNLEFITDSGTATSVGGQIQVFGGAGITTSGSGETVTITATGSGFTWNSVTSANNPVQIVKENGYICNGASQVVFILPLAPSIGDMFKIVSAAATFKITENGSQSMRIGAQISTAGSGTIVSNTVGDNVEIVYIGSNVFMAFAPQGTLTAT